MTSEGFSHHLREQREAVERTLDRCLPLAEREPTRLHQAMRHSVFAGGKRLRPILCLAACRAAGGREEDALEPAAALEMVHTYTLIHDDLPCMDDDDLRRGRPTCHRAYGEAAAVLSGLALLVRAFELLAGSPAPPPQRRAMMEVLAREAGPAGVVGGQVEDLLAEGREPDPGLVRSIHERKTASLIRAPLLLGALAAEAPEEVRATLALLGTHLGHAFQITDDILGEVSTEAELGKPVGSDRERGKATMVRALGLEGARREADRLAALTREALDQLPGDPEPLRALIDWTIQRRS